MTEAAENTLDPEELLLEAGIAVSELISSSELWMNRRVETVEILTYEETRYRVSVDFTLEEPERQRLRISSGLYIVPLGALSKEPRNHFDTCDESGSSFPILNQHDNAQISHFALLKAAMDAIPPELPSEKFDELSENLRRVALGNYDEALAAAERQQQVSDRWSTAMFKNPHFVRMLSMLISNYIVFAVQPVSSVTSDRRILKYSFGFDGFTRNRKETFSDKWRRLKEYPDGYLFTLNCAGIEWSKSYHVEFAIPEEIRAVTAYFGDPTKDEVLGEVQTNSDRVSLHFPPDLPRNTPVEAVAELIPERAGAISQATFVALLIAATLIVGFFQGLNSVGEDSLVSILLVGVAFFGGLTSHRGQHRLVGETFSGTRWWINLSIASAILGAFCIAFWSAGERPSLIWDLATLISTIAATRITWSWWKAAERVVTLEGNEKDT